MSGENADSPPVPNKVFGVGVDIAYPLNNRRLEEQSRLTKKYILLVAGFYSVVLRVFFVFDISWE
jgi:hypothetical protein